MDENGCVQWLILRAPDMDRPDFYGHAHLVSQWRDIDADMVVAHHFGSRLGWWMADMR